jgi:hypothetical protein
MKTIISQLQSNFSLLQRLGEPFALSAEQTLVLTCTFVLAFNLGHAFYR